MKKIFKYALWIVFLCPVIYLVFIWNTLPEQVPMHFDMEGKVNRYGSRNELLGMLAFLVPLNIGTYFLVTNVHRLDPKKKYTKENMASTYKLAFAISVFLSVVTCFVIYTSTTGSSGVKGNFVFPQ